MRHHPLSLLLCSLLPLLLCVLFPVPSLATILPAAPFSSFLPSSYCANIHSVMQGRGTHSMVRNSLTGDLYLLCLDEVSGDGRVVAVRSDMFGLAATVTTIATATDCKFPTMLWRGGDGTIVDGKLYVACNGGGALLQIDIDNGYALSHPFDGTECDTSKNVWALQVTSNGQLLVACEGVGVLRLASNRLTYSLLMADGDGSCSMTDVGGIFYDTLTRATLVACGTMGVISIAPVGKNMQMVSETQCYIAQSFSHTLSATGEVFIGKRARTHEAKERIKKKKNKNKIYSGIRLIRFLSFLLSLFLFRFVPYV